MAWPKGKNLLDVLGTPERVFEVKAKRYRTRQRTLAEKHGGLDAPRQNHLEEKAWSLAVKERDGFICQHCGTKDDLEAHHLKSWTDYPSLRYTISNGITLCRICHQEEEKRLKEIPETAGEEQVPF